MRNSRTILAATALFLALSMPARALDGWMSTGLKPTPTPTPAASTTTSEGEAATAANDEDTSASDMARELGFSILRNVLGML